MNFRPTILVIISCFSLTLTTIATSAQNGESFFDYLQNNDIHELNVFAPIDQMVIHKMKDTSFQMSLKIAGPKEFEIPGKIRVRGKFRRKHCDFPPIEFNFKKGNLKDQGFAKYDKYKVVTHCSKDAIKNMALQREYYIYQLYNIIDTISFRVHDVMITFIDPKSSRQESYQTFLIESNDQLEDRLDGKFVEKFGLKSDQLKGLETEREAMFHHMIGNKDFDIQNMHNCKILLRPDSTFRSVPYDFDYAKIVYAPYAHPAIETEEYLEERPYLGYQCFGAFLPEVIMEYKSNKEKLLAVIEEAELLRGKDRRFMRKYIESFFKRLENYPEELHYNRKEITKN